MCCRHFVLKLLDESEIVKQSSYYTMDAFASVPVQPVQLALVVVPLET